MLIKLIKLFQNDESLKNSMFIPWISTSQPCESLFRAARSITSTFSTVINFSIPDFMSRIDQIFYINSVINDLCDEYIFPREKKTYGKNVVLCSDEELNNIDINLIVNKAKEDAFNNIRELGIIQDKEIAENFDIKFQTEPNEEYFPNEEVDQEINDEVEDDLHENAEENINASENYLFK
ncbi:unnamed protein product [Ceutorhynchus assimilis]|uniref:HAT C-terminal dimerisation domain-containing protein n=1 Tax=Ceutorhynchus assimilis TaxID=467358 RepID=A0A9N9QNV5_9CUCU|nr:unnamed protein product [Ceutorhynchus assimilis]